MWITPSPRYAAVDHDVLQESALAVAQATIQNAMDEAGIKPAALAKKLGWHRSAVSRLLSGRQNLTIKTFALALAGCGFRPQFAYIPLVWRWAAEPPDVPSQTVVPTTVGTSMRAGSPAPIEVLTLNH